MLAHHHLHTRGGCAGWKKRDIVAVAVERPTILNQMLVIVALVVAFETRAQAAVLLLSLPAIIVLHVLAEERATIEPSQANRRAS